MQVVGLTCRLSAVGHVATVRWLQVIDQEGGTVADDHGVLDGATVLLQLMRTLLVGADQRPRGAGRQINLLIKFR